MKMKFPVIRNGGAASDAVRNICSIGSCLVVVALLGCAAKNAQRDYSFTNNNEGIAFFSVSHDQSGGRRAQATFYIDGGPANEKGSYVDSLNEPFPGIRTASDFKDSYGQLVVLSLPPGRHRIDSWQITNGAGLRIFPREKPSPLEFQVEAGRAKYVGNLHANLETGKNVFGATIVGNGYPEVRDQRSRDIEIFESRYPQFRGQVLIDLLSLGPWVGNSERRVDIPPPVQSLPARK